MHQFRLLDLCRGLTRLHLNWRFQVMCFSRRRLLPLNNLSYTRNQRMQGLLPGDGGQFLVMFQSVR